MRRVIVSTILSVGLLAAGGTAAAAPVRQALLSVVPASAEAVPGRTEIVQVTPGGDGTVSPVIYSFDPQTGHLLTLPHAREIVRIDPSGPQPATAGHPILYRITPTAGVLPAGAQYLDVAFVLHGARALVPTHQGSMAVRVAQSFLLAFPAVAPTPPRIYPETSLSPVAVGDSARLVVQARDVGAGWVSPDAVVRVSGWGVVKYADLGLLLPGDNHSVTIPLAGLPVGWHTVDVSFDVGRYRSQLVRHVFVLPEGVVAGALVGGAVVLLVEAVSRLRRLLATR